jgi:hypothetical protein
MSVDAGLYLRWADGLAPSADELARMIGLSHESDPRGWRKATASDTCLMWIRISADASDRIGPSPAPEGTPDRFAERAYDHWLHISPSRLAPYAEDGFASLRAYCREVIGGLRHEGLVESAFDVDGDSWVSYWAATRDAFGAEVLPDVELDAWWAAGLPDTTDRPDIRNVLTANLSYAGDGDSRTTGRFVPQAEAVNAISETIGLRAAELPFHRTARVKGCHVPAGELDSFSDQLVAELAGPGEVVDVAVWVNNRLCRYEVAAQPTDDLRVPP